jgi:hypothetical protein
MVPGADHAAREEEFFAAAHAAVNLLLHRRLGNAETLGDLALGEMLELAEQDDFPATRGQRIERLREQRDLLAQRGGRRRVRALGENGQRRQIGHSHKGRNLFAAREIERHMARHLEEKRLGRGDGLRGARLPDAQVGFLHDVVHIAHGGKRAAQIGAQHGLVRLHFIGKPVCLVGVGRHRDGKHATRNGPALQAGSRGRGAPTRAGRARAGR